MRPKAVTVSGWFPIKTLVPTHPLKLFLIVPGCVEVMNFELAGSTVKVTALDTVEPTGSVTTHLNWVPESVVPTADVT